MIKLSADNLPVDPRQVYRNNGYISVGDFLGTGYIHGKYRKYLSYNDAQEFVLKLDLRSRKEWYKYCQSGQKPSNIPKTPDHIYKNIGWVGYSTFLRNKHYRGPWLSFKDARKFVRKLGFKHPKEWLDYCKSGNKPYNIPIDPRSYYKNKGFISMPDFLGYLGRQRHKLPYEEAKLIIQKLDIKNKRDYIDHYQSNHIPKNIPGDPSKAYKDLGWESWGLFLGTDNKWRGRPKNHD